MNILRLQTQDLFSYESLDLSLANRGLVLVEGQNLDDEGLDSNASGKTTIFRSLTWILYDETLSKQRGDEVIRWSPIEQKYIVGNTCGVCELDVDGQRVEVRRHRKHTQQKNLLQLFVDGNEVTGSTNRDTQKRVNEILHLDATAFLNVVMYPQRSQGFASGTDAEQKAILERVLCMERFSEAQARMKSRQQQYTQTIDKTKVYLNSQRERIQDAETTLRSLEDRETAWVDGRAQRIAEAKARVAQLMATPATIDASLAEKIQEKSQQVANLAKTQEMANSAERSLLTKQHRRTILRGEIRALQDTIVELGEEPKKPEFSSDRYAKQVAACEKDLQRHEFDLVHAKDDVARLRKAVELRDTTDTCENCGQVLTEDAKTHLFGNLSEELQIAEMKFDSLSGMQSTFTIGLTSAQSGYDQAIEYEGWQVTEKQNLRVADSIRDKEYQLAPLDAEIAELENILATAREMAQDASQAQDELAHLKELEASQRAAHELWRRDIEQAEATLVREEQSQSPHADLISSERVKLGKLKSDSEKRQAYLHEFESELPYIDYWVRGFGNTGVKSLLFETAIPFLNERANEYLQVLCGSHATVEFSSQTELASGEKREKFNVKVRYAHGSRDENGISGGELQRADLAVLFALGDLSSSRALAPVKLRLLDEPFDNLDGVGKERVVQLLEHHIAPRVGTLLVMSHDADLQSMFSETITVTKSGGVSRLAS